MIEVHDLHRPFGRREEVAGIGFCVPRGEISSSFSTERTPLMR